MVIREQHHPVSAAAAAAAAATRSPSPRVVLHVDLDAFFVQVERSLNPTLIDKPIAIQHHADIIAVSYEARALGVTKHMPISVIRREHPSVKLVHVETIGLHKDKVSYKNYRAAARAIFTLVRAFCSPQGSGNVDDTRGWTEGKTAQKGRGRKLFMGTGGRFQKVSIDEAYLEPTRRTLLAELRVSSRQRREEGRLLTSTGSSTGSTGLRRAVPAAAAARSSPARAKRPRDGDCDVSSGPCYAQTSAQRFNHGDCSVGASSRFHGSSHESQGEGSSGEQGGSDMGVGCDSLDNDGKLGGRVRSGIPGYSPWATKGEKGDEDRLLEAGGLLGRRIQQTLNDVLKYDCSVGVAGNKFLAKLATGLAKPKGVHVLLSRDVPSVLASTPAVKIPGCGAGSVASKEFAVWGASSVLDLQHVNAAELRNRLGEQLGAKVHDRCRGIDHDPVEPDPIPNKVSSQLSLFPLITPAKYLGQPKEKPIPVLPWEVERIRPLLVTLVEDLLDRMKEELTERNRRPTKICVEHHLHQRGSKGQTFSLPAPSSRRFGHRSSFTACNLAGGFVDGQRTEGFPALMGAEDKRTKIEDLLSLLPVASLVELALTPFINYRSSRRAATMQGVAGVTGEGRKDRRNRILPPVVKLSVSFLGFEDVNLPPHATVSPGQRTLRDMLCLDKDKCSDEAAVANDSKRNERDAHNGVASSSPSKREVSRTTAAGAPAAEIVVPSPVARAVPAVSPSMSGVRNPLVINNAADLRRKGCVEAEDNFKSSQTVSGESKSAPQKVTAVIDKGDIPPKSAEAGSVFVRCPRCHACLPVGDAWDSHREEHMSIVAFPGHDQVGFRRRRDPSALSHKGEAALPLWSPLPSQGQPPHAQGSPEDTSGIRSTPPNNLDSLQFRGGCGVHHTRPLNAGGEKLSRVASAAEIGDDDGRDNGRLQSRKLSELLMMAVTPGQAANVLKEYGFVRNDGQTRFKDLSQGKKSLR